MGAFYKAEEHFKLETNIFAKFDRTSTCRLHCYTDVYTDASVITQEYSIFVHVNGSLIKRKTER